MAAPPVFPRHSLLSCGACSDVFLNWTRTGTSCRSCGSVDLHEIRWIPDQPMAPRTLSARPAGPSLVRRS